MKTLQKQYWIKRSIIMLMACILLFSGCSMLNKITGKDQKQQSQEQPEKIPKELQDIEAAFETIFADLKGPTISQQEEGQGEQGAQQSEQGQDKQQQNSEGKDQQSTQGDSSSQSGGEQSNKNASNASGDQGKEQQQAADPFQKVNQEVRTLHYLWNEYMPEANKKAAQKEIIAGFSNDLNILTETLQSKDIMKIMLANNSLYASIPDFYALYKTQISPEIKQILYRTRSCILYAQNKDWTKVASNMEELKSSWAFLKNTLEKEQQEDAAKLDLSIVELEKVIKEKNPELISIKGKITLTNINTLNKALENANKDKSQKKS